MLFEVTRSYIMTLSLLLEERRPGNRGELQHGSSAVPLQANTKSPLCPTLSPRSQGEAPP